jgi:hypothetical protein
MIHAREPEEMHAVNDRETSGDVHPDHSVGYTHFVSNA